MKKWVVILVVLVAVSGIGFWFWSLAALPTEAAQEVMLTVENPAVSVRAPGSSLWEEATSGMTIGVGWSVRTDKGGLASIRFFDQGESRIGENSEITVSAASIDTNDPTKLSIKLKLDFGRVWSRVLKLFDLDSSYSVETSSVVATVRGTAFDVQATENGGAEVWVSESAVDVAPSKGIAIDTPDAIPEGFSALFAPDGSAGDPTPITDETKNGRWFRTNHDADMAFVATEKAERKDELKRLGGSRPDSVLAGITGLSEKLHLAFADKEEQDGLAERYFARRFARLIELVEAGKAGLASQEFARLENFIRTELQGEGSDIERRRIRAALARVSILVEDADPDSALFPFKQRIENLTEALSGGEADSVLFVRLLALDARLDEAVRFANRNKFDASLMALDVAKSGLENVNREAEGILSGLTKERRRALRGKIDSLRAREGVIRIRVQASLIPTDETATSTEDGTTTPTSTAPTTPTTPTTQTPTTPTTPPPTTTVPPPPTGSPLYSSIRFFIQPNPLDVGKTSNLVVLGVRKDGAGEDDVSARATFTHQGGLGTLNGPTFTGTKSGNGTIQASYNDAGTTLTSTVSVTVKGTAVLQSLNLTSATGGTVTRYTPTQMFASAHYSDGYNKSVTAQTTFVSMNAAAGTMNGNNFQPQANYTGPPVEIQGTFTESGITVTGSIYLTIQ